MKMLVSFIAGGGGGGGGGGGDGGAGFWRKTSSCNSSVSSGFLWSIGLIRLDSEIRSEDRWRYMDGSNKGEDAVLPLSLPFDGAANWKWGWAVGGTLVLISAECSPLISRLKALSLYVSFAVSSNMLASLMLCLVCVSIGEVSPTPSPVPVCGMPGKVMASKLAWLSLSLACHSMLPLSCVLDGEKGQGRPTEAAKVEVLLARSRSPFRCRSLRVTGVGGGPGSRTEGRVSKIIQRGVKVLGDVLSCAHDIKNNSTGPKKIKLGQVT